MAESVDWKPLATSISDLFYDFPYGRLPDSIVLQLFLRPECVAALLIFYLISKPMFGVLQTRINPKASWFVGAVAVHNLVMAVFSAVVAWNAWPIVVANIRTHGLFDTYCDPEGTLWGPDSGFGAWAFVFYISKYYEFADTWILVLKGKQPSFLQVYHHTGIAFCMWVGVLSQSSWLFFIVLFNSVVHTLMYTYFFIKTVNPKANIRVARYLTMTQIGQFFAGIGCSFGVLVMGEKCDTRSSRAGLVCLHLYGYGLVALFVAFAKRKYSKKKAS